MSTVDPGKLETEKIGRLLWQYSVPAVVATMATSLYNVVDRVFIGQGAGSMAISGLALCFPIMTLIQAFGTLVGVGASSKISIVLGMNDKDWAERILGNAILLTFVIWACICTSCLFFLDPLLRLFGGSEQTIPYASAYLKIIIPGSIFSNLAYSYSNIIRASGSPGKSMQFMLIGVGANVILDPLFIFGLNMGIEGAAYATVISMFISACFTMQFFMGQKTYIRFHRQKIRMRSSTIKDIVSIGLSPFLMNVAASVVNIILNNKLHNYGGDLAIGAYGIINSYAILFVMFVIGICQGMQPIVGYNYGAGKIERSKKALFLAFYAATVVTTFGFILIELAPAFMAGLFTKDIELINITKTGLRIVFLLHPLLGFQIVTGNFFQSIGKAKLSIFLSLTRQVLFLIPALYICSSFWGLSGVWGAIPVADGLSVLLAIYILNRQFFWNKSSQLKD